MVYYRRRKYGYKKKYYKRRSNNMSNLPVYRMPAANYGRDSSYSSKFILKTRTYGLSDVGGQFNPYMYCMDPSSALDWTHIVSMFDLYRVTYCTMEILPMYNNSSEPYVIGGIQWGSLFMAYDPNLPAILPANSYDIMTEYSSLKTFALSKGNFKYGVKPALTLYNTPSTAGVPTYYKGKQWLMTTQANGYQNSVIFSYMNGIPPGLGTADIIRTWYIEACSRR